MGQCALCDVPRCMRPPNTGSRRRAHSGELCVRVLERDSLINPQPLSVVPCMRAVASLSCHAVTCDAVEQHGAHASPTNRTTHRQRRTFREISLSRCRKFEDALTPNLVRAVSAWASHASRSLEAAPSAHCTRCIPRQMHGRAHRHIGDEDPACGTSQRSARGRRLHSVHLHGTVDLQHKPPRGEETHGARHHREEQRADEHVREVKHRGDETHDL